MLHNSTAVELWYKFKTMVLLGTIVSFCRLFPAALASAMAMFGLFNGLLALFAFADDDSFDGHGFDYFDG